MRSDLVFDAHALVPNRFLLCKLVSKAARAFHRPGDRIHDTTNDVLVRIGHANSIAQVQASHEHAVYSNRHQRVALPVQCVPIPSTLRPTNRVAQASIDLGRILGEPPARLRNESTLDQQVLH